MFDNWKVWQIEKMIWPHLSEYNFLEYVKNEFLDIGYFD